MQEQDRMTMKDHDTWHTEGEGTHDFEITGCNLNGCGREVVDAEQKCQVMSK
jgi:hypothetical protein